MVALLPPESLHSILQKCPCRRPQIQELATYYNDTFPSPSVLVAYGLESTSKTIAIVEVLRWREIPHGIVKCRECLSQRHLLSKIFAVCVAALGREQGQEQGNQTEQQFDRTDSINALVGNLRRLFERVVVDSKSSKKNKFVAVIEDADALRQPGPTLLPALARLGDVIPGFSVILTSSSPRPLNLHKTGVPCVHFPPYTRSEAISIIVSTQPTTPSLSHSALASSSGTSTSTAETDQQQHAALLSKLYAQFAVTVYDTLISSTSSTSIDTFRLACERLWPRFIEPIVSGEEPPARAKSWDFARLLVRNRGLFRSEGEDALHNTFPRTSLPDNPPEAGSSLQQQPRQDAVRNSSAPATPSKRAPLDSSKSAASRESASKPWLSQTSSSSSSITRPSLLKHFPTLVLLSAYLASHTLPKHDILLFSRLSATSSSISKKIRRLRQTPTKRKTTSTPSGTPTKDATTPTKSRNKSLFAAGANLGIPRPFTLERLVAILRAIHPQGIPNRPGRGVSDRIYRELGELERLRLVVRSSGSGAATGAGGTGDDAGDEKWRVNVGREWVVNMGHMWGMGVSEYEIDPDS
ncbi:origin recognition complex subunit Orc5 [Fonsecaea pedrosoi]|nr:origin recognition complex subunit Orc5 [Fonsecaea pedrosoi]